MRMVSSKTGVKCRKPHPCCWCGQYIEKGELSNTQAIDSDGEIANVWAHPECDRAMEESGLYEDDTTLANTLINNWDYAPGWWVAWFREKFPERTKNWKIVPEEPTWRPIDTKDLPKGPPVQICFTSEDVLAIGKTSRGYVIR